MFHPEYTLLGIITRTYFFTRAYTSPLCHYFTAVIFFVAFVLKQPLILAALTWKDAPLMHVWSPDSWVQCYCGLKLCVRHQDVGE